MIGKQFMIPTMKVRSGHVANSSSSSYTCVVCGDEVSGHDIDFEDYGLCECENNHIFHQQCVYNPDEDGTQLRTFAELILNMKIQSCEKRLTWIDESKHDDIHEEIRSYKQDLLVLDSQNDETIMEMINDDSQNTHWRYNYPKEFCPMCSLSKIDDGDVLEYYIKEYDLSTKDKVIKEIQDRFNNLGELNTFLKDS